MMVHSAECAGKHCTYKVHELVQVAVGVVGQVPAGCGWDADWWQVARARVGQRLVVCDQHWHVVHYHTAWLS